MFGRQFTTTAAGTISVRLDRDIRRLIGELLEQLREVLLVGDGDDIRRLYPTAYPDDAELEDAYRGLVHDQLLMQRLDALDRVQATLDNDELSVDDADLWMSTINQVRLVLGTKLDVSEDDDMEIDPDDPGAFAQATYQVLSVVLGNLTDARMRLL